MILVAGDYRNSGTTITWELLKQNKSALEAIELGIRAVELNEADPSVGLGGYPNAAGLMELDAGVMDGRTRESGAVGALQGFKHPISVAYAVMRRLSHVLLVGEGAARFAEEIGAERGELLTIEMRNNWLKWCKEWSVNPENPDGDLIGAVTGGNDPQRSGGTTVYLAQDRNGDIAVATSTSGWAWKYPGRLGDSPIAGAGFYADNRYGTAACTGTGELAIRTGLARMTVAYMKTGMSTEEAVREALADVQQLPNQYSGITLYAINAMGEHFVGCILGDSSFVPHYFTAVDGDALPTERCAVRIG
jgi:beta-aspartyl-peptidase (threonine type)